MNVGSFGQVNAYQPLSRADFSTSQTTSVNTDTSEKRSRSASLSTAAQNMQELSQLASSNPDQLKQVASDIASQLQTAAQSATGNDAKALNDLASKFQQVSQTGSLSALQGGKGHHHHHGGPPPAANGAPPPPPPGAPAGGAGLDADGDHDGSTSGTAASVFNASAANSAYKQGSQPSSNIFSTLNSIISKELASFASNATATAAVTS